MPVIIKKVVKNYSSPHAKLKLLNEMGKQLCKEGIEGGFSMEILSRLGKIVEEGQSVALSQIKSIEVKKGV